MPFERPQSCRQRSNCSLIFSGKTSINQSAIISRFISSYNFIGFYQTILTTSFATPQHNSHIIANHFTMHYANPIIQIYELASAFIILMIFILFLSLLSLSIAQNCQPFGVRLQYGQALQMPNQTQKIAISFNTQSPCTSSFLRILGRTGFIQIPCESHQIVTSSFMNFFTTYVQRCSITNQVKFSQTFYYNVYGWSVNQAADPLPGLQDWVQCNIIDPVAQTSQINILTLADWGVIKTTGFTPIAESLRNVMADKEFKLMVVLGDICYDLDSDNGNRYMEFLAMAQEFISKIPCVFIPGNHENYSEDDKILLNSTFQLYGLSLNLATGFQFGDTYLLPFDPYEVAYARPGSRSSLEALTSQLQLAAQTGLFIIPMSHYPLICSGQSSVCQAVLANLHSFYDTMVEYGASFYLGAHAHIYERIYPYFANGTFQKIESPYRDDQGYLVSIVEGVGGSDTDLVESIPKVYDYTASYTVNQTGFGVLTINSNNQILFQQYSTLQGYVDSMVVNKYKTRQTTQPQFEQHQYLTIEALK